MTQAEKMIEGVDAQMRPQALALAKAALVLEKKIKQQSKIYMNEPLAQEVTVGTGETILRSNPIVQEYRATIREYAQTLKSLKELLGHTQNSNVGRSANLVVVGGSRWKRSAS